MANDFTVEEIANLFHMADQDKNGKLSRDEIILIMKQLKDGNPPSSEDIDACMRIMDENGDGVISEQEFLNAMITWLGIIDKTAQNTNQRQVNSRTKTLQDMAKFFLQFLPVPNFHEEQKKILYRKRSELDMRGAHREYPIYQTTESKAQAYEIIQRILLEGRAVVLNEIYSMDWQVVLNGIMRVQTILSIVEIFPTSDEKFEFSSSIFQIFDGVSEVDNRDGKSVCIIRRICQLLSPDVPIELQPTVYSLCLACLRNYITGPGLIPPISVQIDVNNVWNQNNSFTRFVVESEGLPHRLLGILDQYYLDPNSYLFTAPFMNNPISVELIIQILRCLSAFCEENTGCLEGMLRIGARKKIVQLLSNENFFHLSVLRSGLGCLAVLCGYTHVFQFAATSEILSAEEFQVEGLSNGNKTEIKSIPLALTFEERELFDLLSLISHLLDRFILMSNAAGTDLDPIVTLNIGIVCRYLLPLCPQEDPLYQSILPHLIHLFHHQWTLSDPHQLNALLSLDSCLLELMLTSKVTCQVIWDSTNISLVLFNQMQYASETISTSPLLSSEISHLCIDFYNCLISYELYNVFNSHKNYSFHKLCIHMLSHQNSEGYHLNLLHYLFNSLISSPSLTPILISFDLLQELFTILIKFKHNSNTLSEIFQTSQISSLYNIQMIKYVAKKLIEFLSISSPSSPSTTPSTPSPSPSIQYIKMDHVERIQQLHGIILIELKKGHLQLTAELEQMTETVLELLKLIVVSYDNFNCPNEEVQRQKDRVLSESRVLIERWNIDLNAAYREGLNSNHFSSSSSSEMELAQSNVIPLIPNSHYSINDLIIIAVPLWESCNSLTQYSLFSTVYVPSNIAVNRLINGFCVMCQMNVLVNFISPQTNLLTTLSTQMEFMNFYSYLQDHHVKFHSHVVMTLYLTQSSPPSGAAQLRPTFNTVTMNSLHNPFESTAYQLKQKDITLKSLQRSLQTQGKSLNMELMSLFYDYIRECNLINSNNSNEITQDQFVAALTSEKLNFSPQFASDIFYSFDTDHNGTLNLTEISIGFAKLMNSNFDEKLELIFNAYDRDHNGVLDLNELIDMIQVATGLPFNEAKQYAIAVGNEVDENGSNTIEFNEFKEAVYKKLIPLEMSWSDSSSLTPQQISNQSTKNIPKFWKQSKSVIQSTGNKLPQNIFPSKRSQTYDFGAMKSPGAHSKGLGQGHGGGGGSLEGMKIRRAFSADFNSEGYEETSLDNVEADQQQHQQQEEEEEEDPILAGIGMTPDEKEGIYIRKRSEEDELESKFLNRKQRVHSQVAFQEEPTPHHFSPHTSPRNVELRTFSSEGSPAHHHHHQGSSIHEEHHEEGGEGEGEEDEEEESSLARPPTPILSITRRNSELQQNPTHPDSTTVDTTTMTTTATATVTATTNEESRKRSNREVAKSSPLPTPPEEKSAIRESKLKDIKKNPFSKSPK